MAMADYRRVFVSSLFTDIIGFAQAVLYFLSVFFGLLVTIPLGITLRNFEGGCILFAQIVWDNKVIYPWIQSSCNFILFSNLGINVVYGVFMAIFMLLAVWPRVGANEYEKVGVAVSWNISYILVGMTPVLTLITVIIVFLQLSSSILLVAGFDKFCFWLSESMEELGMPLKSCASAQGIDWNMFRIRNGDVEGVAGQSFYTCLMLASISSWILLIIWVVQLCLLSYRTCTCCSCEIADEKRKVDRSAQIAQRRSRMATPIGTPGGRHTPVGIGLPGQQQRAGYGPPGAGYGPPGAGYGPPGAGYGPPGVGYGPPGAGYGPPGAGYGQPGQQGQQAYG